MHRHCAISRLGVGPGGDGRPPLLCGSLSSAAPRRSPRPGRLVLLQDWAPTQQFLNELQRQLLVTGAVIFTFALVGGLVFSRRVPAAQGYRGRGARYRRWRLDAQVPLRGGAEATTLATAFNDMTKSLRDQAERLKSSASIRSPTPPATPSSPPTGRQYHVLEPQRPATFGYPENEVLGPPPTSSWPKPFAPDPESLTPLRSDAEQRSAARSRLRRPQRRRSLPGRVLPLVAGRGHRR